jgi:hypothetical protein
VKRFGYAGFILLFVLGGCSATPSARAAAYGNRIVLPAAASSALQASAADAVDALQKMTGQKYSLTNGDTGPGILLMRRDSAKAPADLVARLKGKGLEAFAIRSSDDKILWIIANGEQGLVRGLYYYLDQLGVRYYYPGDDWTIIPKRDDCALKVDTVREPAFVSRSFFGTGGFGPSNPVDPKLAMRGRWADWQRRIGFVGQLPPVGHAGGEFNVRYKKELEAHPAWRAMIDGERVPYSPGMKINVANADVMALYTQDRLDALQKQIERYGADSPLSLYVGVGPTDGGGFSNGPDVAKIGSGSVSDQMFYMANIIARAVAKKFPGHGVALLAYDGFAAVPTIKLEPNIHVVIIPYAFQRTGLTGDELLEAWVRKIKRDGLDKFSPIGMYTYWSITDWSRDLPGFDFLHTPKERIPYWYKQGVREANFESTYSPGATGPGLYVASRLLWDPHVDSDAIIDEFYKRCFGPAEAPMRRMLERWTDNFLLTDQELALSYRDLAEAEQLAAGDEAVLARIGGYIGYVQYLRQWHEFQIAPKGEQRTEQARKLARLVWQIYPSGMVQSYRMWQLLGNRYARDAELNSYFNPTQKDAPEWKDLQAPTQDELAQWLKQGLADYKPLDFERKTFTGKLVPLNPQVRPQEGFIGGIASVYSTKFYALALPGVHELPLKIVVRKWNDNPPDKITVTGPEGKEVFSQSVPIGETQTLQVPMPVPGLYTITVQDQVTGFHLFAGAGIPLVTDEFRPWGISPRLYFYVPKGLKKLAIYSPPQPAKPNTLFDPNGKEIDLRDRTAPLVVIDVPEGMDGKVWSIKRNSASGAVQLLNAPNYFAFSPDTLLIPEDAK